MKLNLPKPHFSYSQLSLWLKNKQQYRERYYLDAPAFESKETLFGKRIARMFETGEKDPVLDLVPRYSTMEHRLQLKIGGVPFLGYLDSFNPVKKAIIEVKTGKEPWDAVRVHKHLQLVIYSLLVKTAYGKVDPVVKLVWIETRYKQEKQKLGNREMEGDSNELEFTGRIEIFERKIAEWERKNMKKLILKSALEISEDYSKFNKKL